MFMDVTTNFGGRFIPTQADKLERGPVRLRSALQFSLNIPAIKSTLIMGLDHVFERSKDFGLTFPGTAVPVKSMGIGTLEVHPIDLLGAYATIANGGVRMPRQTILAVTDQDGRQVWPIGADKPEGVQVISKQAAYIITDIMAGNTVKKVNPYWGEWAIYDGSRRRPAAYKTGTTSDNRDVHAYGYLAPPKEKDLPALAVGVWMGNSNNQPNRGSLSLDSSAPLWSAILTDISRDLPIRGFKAPSGLKTATVDAFTGLRPGPFTRKTVKELFIPGTQPKKKETIRVALEIDKASGLLWRDGCVGPKVTRGYFDLSEVEANFPAWVKANRSWAARAAKRGRGPKGTRPTYFYNGSFAPYGRSWGAPFPPSKKCPIAPPPEPEPCDPLDPACPVIPPGGGDDDDDDGGGNGRPQPTPKP
jgi:membrane peptidoglycan carboxypeptidase